MVHLDRGEPVGQGLARRQAATDGDHGPAEAFESGELEHAQPEREGDQGVQPPSGQQVGDDRGSTLRVLADVVERQVVPVPHELVRGALEHGGEEPPVDGGGHQPDVAGAARGERRSGGVRHVAERGDGLLDSGARGGRHGAGAGEGAGGGGGGDPGHAGDVLDADHRRSSSRFMGFCGGAGARRRRAGGRCVAPEYGTAGAVVEALPFRFQPVLTSAPTPACPCSCGSAPLCGISQWKRLHSWGLTPSAAGGRRRLTAGPTSATQRPAHAAGHPS